MLLYNETIGIDKEIEKDWLVWMRETYIPSMMRTGVFIDSKIYRILHENEDGTISYSVQYFASTLDNIQTYLDVFAPTLVEEHRKRYANKHVVFRTLLQQV